MGRAHTSTKSPSPWRLARNGCKRGVYHIGNLIAWPGQHKLAQSLAPSWMVAYTPLGSPGACIVVK